MMENKNEVLGYARLNFYTLVWSFMWGSFIGYLIETAFYFYKRGYFVNRQGVIYGPFSEIYGVGIIIMLLCLYYLRNQKNYIVFIASMALGTLFEYISSIILMEFFGYVSWNYSKYPFNYEGRICLYASIGWGIFGMVYLKYIFPFTCRMLYKLKKSFYKWLLIAFFVFMVFDLILSTYAVNRMKERHFNLPPNNRIEKIMDRYYPDERLKEIYTSVKFVEYKK